MYSTCLCKYLIDLTYVIDYEPLQVNADLSYKEMLVRILAHEVNVLRTTDIAFVKVP